MARHEKVELTETGVENIFAEPGADGVAVEHAEAAIGRLPGVVNDLPEVAPHEWIYIMS